MEEENDVGDITQGRRRMEKQDQLFCFCV